MIFSNKNIMPSEKELFLKKFEEKLKERLDPKVLASLKNDAFNDDLLSYDYEQFRIEQLPSNFTLFEKACNFSQSLLPVAPDKKTEEKLSEQLQRAHLLCSAVGVMSLTLLFSLTLIILGLIFFLLISSTMGVGFLLLGLGSYFVIQNIPYMLARRFKSKANDQIIIAIFYIVAYMRFSSNFELAINFAANYLGPPLSLDFKKLLWELDNSKYPTLKEAFDYYLEDWRDSNLEFLEAIYLIESSLYESEDIRRITLLDKSLDIILQGNYEKMLHYAQELRGKVQTFNMIGVVLPILGLIILPLAASFGNPRSVWEFVFMLYVIVLPAVVFYFGFTIIFNRPAGINSIKMPDFKSSTLGKAVISFGKKKMYFNPKWPALFIFFFFLLIGLSPLIINNAFPVLEDSCMNEFEVNLNENMGLIASRPFDIFQEYKDVEGVGCYGPYGTIPGLLSLFLPLSLAFGVGYYLKIKYKELIHVRDKTKELEKQFPSATFQLGNRINEGISAELAFGAVADTMKGTEASVFFSIIDTNVKFNGMSVEKAIFDSKKGALLNYPSDLITSSMKILINALNKGPEITAKTLIDLSRYLSEIHMGNERMLDLLGESIGSMKGQSKFLAPLISGVVISIISLVTLIMGVLADETSQISGATGQTTGNFLGAGMPTYLFQWVVGIYITLLIIILVYVVTNLESGDDPILTKFEMGKTLLSSMTLYSIIVSIGITVFAILASSILSNI